MPARSGLRMISLEPEVIAQEVTDDVARWEGYALKWDDVAEIRDFFFSYEEQFRQGAFEKTIRERGPKGNGAIKLLRQHNSRQAMAGKYTDLYEDDIGLRYSAETIDTSVGRDLREELRAGTLHNMSIGFDAIREEYNKDKNRYTVIESRLWECSPVLWGAYESSTVENVRELGDLPGQLDRFYRALEQGRMLTPEEVGQLTMVRSKLTQILNTDSSEPVNPLGEAPNRDCLVHAENLEAEMELLERELGL